MAGGRGDLLILDSGLLWQTVSNAADKYTARQTVRSGGFLWLNPIAMSVVNCNRAEVVECSCLKPCWSGADIFVDRGKNQRLQDFRGWAEKRDRPI